jgi:hypothetical protein
VGVDPVTKRAFRAPQEDRSILAVPALSEAPGALARNRESLERATASIDGEPLSSFRARARREVLDRAVEYLRAAGEPIPRVDSESLLLSGHQPELFHVGVWVKNFVLNRLARENGLTPLNLVVDNDTMKASSLRFPVLPDSRDPAGVHYQSIPYDRYSGETAYERRAVLDDEAFRAFASNANAVTRNWDYCPVLGEVWESVLRQLKTTRNIGECFARTRREWERKWGCHNFEVPLSHVCETESFRRFRSHLLSDLPRFHTIYNRCVQNYRTENGVRSRNHPVPDLAVEGDWLEVPFWVLDPEQQRRGRFMVRHTSRGHEYRSGEATLREPLHLRTRALTTTLFARLCLGDGFIHGIGGAKYDEVTDSILRAWLGIEPPGYFVVTATLRLPLPGFPARPSENAQTKRELRDLHWNPQRHLNQESPLTREKEKKIAAEPEDKRERKEWFRQLRAVTEAIRPLVQEAIVRARSEEDRQRIEVEANAVLQRRDYSWVLFPEAVLKEFLVTCLNG